MSNEEDVNYVYEVGGEVANTGGAWEPEGDYYGKIIILAPSLEAACERGLKLIQEWHLRLYPRGKQRLTHARRVLRHVVFT